VGHQLTPFNLAAAQLHSYTTAFLWATGFFVVGAALAAVVFPKGNLAKLSGHSPATVESSSPSELL